MSSNAQVADLASERFGRLESLYARIPKVEGCRTNCSDCCGVVPMTGEEADAIPVMIAARPGGTGEMRFTPFNHCGTCEYATPSGCAIYGHRPFICRLFGAVADEPRLTCPHGAKAANPLTPEEARALTDEYVALAMGVTLP